MLVMASAPEMLEVLEWLAEEFWRDNGELCPRCLENRARLAMMYVIDR